MNQSSSLVVMNAIRGWARRHNSRVTVPLTTGSRWTRACWKANSSWTRGCQVGHQLILQLDAGGFRKSPYFGAFVFSSKNLVMLGSSMPMCWSLPIFRLDGCTSWKAPRWIWRKPWVSWQKFRIHMIMLVHELFTHSGIKHAQIVGL